MDLAQIGISHPTFFSENAELSLIIDDACLFDRSLDKKDATRLCAEYSTGALHLWNQGMSGKEILSLLHSFKRWSQGESLHNPLLCHPLLREKKVQTWLDANLLHLRDLESYYYKKYPELFIELFSYLTEKGLSGDLHKPYVEHLFTLIDEDIVPPSLPQLLDTIYTLALQECHIILLRHILQNPRLHPLLEWKIFPPATIIRWLDFFSIERVTELHRTIVENGLNPISELEAIKILFLLEASLPIDKSSLSNTTPSLEPTHLDPASLERFRNEDFVKEEMRKEEILPLTNSMDEREFDALTGKITSLARNQVALKKIAHLSSLMNSGSIDPFFWQDPIFQEHDIHAYIFFAHLLGTLTSKQLATLHTMVGAIKKSPFSTTIPLFLEGGAVNPIAKSLLSRSREFLSPSQLESWMEAMRTYPQVDHYLLCTSSLPINPPKRLTPSEKMGRNWSIVFTFGMLETLHTPHQTSSPVHYGNRPKENSVQLTAKFSPASKPFPPLAGEEVTCHDLFLRSVDRTFYRSHEKPLFSLLSEGIPFATLYKIAPSLLAPQEASIDLLQVDTSSLTLFRDQAALEKALKESESLFESLPEERLKEIAREIALVAGQETTKEKISLLCTLAYSTQYSPEFWDHPLFRAEHIDHYILLAYFMKLLRKEDLATLHTMTFSLAYYQSAGLQVLSFPLFLEDGSISPAAWTMVGHSTHMQDTERRERWFKTMQQEPSLQKHFLYVEETPETTVMQHIATELGLNILFKATSHVNSHFVPSIQGAYELLKVIGGPYLPNPLYRFLLGIPEKMREEHKTLGRTVTLQTNLLPSPLSADSFFAPAAELTLHDLLYHFYIASFIPPSHMRFFMEWSEELEKSLKNFSPKERECLHLFIYQIIDAEFSFYESMDPIEAFPATIHHLSKQMETAIDLFLAGQRVAPQEIPPLQKHLAKWLQGVVFQSLRSFIKNSLEKGASPLEWSLRPLLHALSH